ncbi:TPA: hypothetical protein DDW35_10540, partial [Candidatus Sumerlaeota bacterium]|nr:hypothetical protein [Candidatus Sumerlaeota bacterium]
LNGPVVKTFKINNGAKSTDVAVVSLNSVVTGSTAVKYMASDTRADLDNNTGSWNDYKTSVTFTLSPAKGTKVVYFKVKNSDGLESVVKSATINKTLDTISGVKKTSATASATTVAKAVLIPSSKKTTSSATSATGATTGSATTDVVTSPTLTVDLQAKDYALAVTADGLVGSLTVGNEGSVDAGAFHVALYFWTDATTCLADAILVQEVAVDGLVAGAEITVPFEGVLPGAGDNSVVVYPVFAVDSQSEITEFDASHLLSTDTLFTVK